MRSEKILLVEDDAIAQMTFRRYLKKLHFEHIVVVDSGDAALAAVREHAPDLIFMDIMINGPMDGIETAQRIRANWDTPIIYVTASTDKATFNRAMDTKPEGFLIKPYDLKALRENLEKALTAKQQKASLPNEALEPDYMLDLIYDTADIGMCVTDEQRRFVKVNKAYCRTYGYPESELIGQEFIHVLPEKTRAYAADLHDRYLRGETEESAGDWQVQTKAGEIRDVYVTAGRLTNRQGKRFKVTTVTDVTEEKRQVRTLESALKEREVFMREIHHRVKNNLNIVSGLLFMQSEKVEEDPHVYNLFVESINRIKTMSLVHERLYKYDTLAQIDLKEYLQSLTDSLFDSFAADEGRIRLRTDLEPISVDIDQAINCGLIVNEIVSNSFKYAFPKGRSGEIYLLLKRKDSKVQLTVGDDGVGLPPGISPEKNGTLGMQLIHNLARQLPGTVTVSEAGATEYIILL